ncbi:putative regulator of ribonuclease activity [compost metagenome]
MKALAANPRKSVKKGEGEVGAVLRFAEVVIEPGDYLYADADGIVVADGKLD